MRAQRSLVPHTGSCMMTRAYSEGSLGTYCRYLIDVLTASRIPVGMYDQPAVLCQERGQGYSHASVIENVSYLPTGHPWAVLLREGS